jgi:hypothetical protein
VEIESYLSPCDYTSTLFDEINDSLLGFVIEEAGIVRMDTDCGVQTIVILS